MLTPPPSHRGYLVQSQSSSNKCHGRLPEEGLGRLSRQAALDSLLNPLLETYPPQSNVKLPTQPANGFEWRYGALLVLHSVTLRHQAQATTVLRRLANAWGNLWSHGCPYSSATSRSAGRRGLLPPKMNVARGQLKLECGANSAFTVRSALHHLPTWGCEDCLCRPGPMMARCNCICRHSRLGS